MTILESAAAKQAERPEVFASRKVIFEAETTFLPPGQTTVTINTDPLMKADVDRSLAIKRIKTEPAVKTTTRDKHYANILLDVRARPIDIAFQIFLKHGEDQYACGSVTAKAEWSGSSEVVAFLPIDLTGKRIEVIFRPAPEIAEKTTDLFEVWGEETTYGYDREAGIACRGRIASNRTTSPPATNRSGTAAG